MELRIGNRTTTGVALVKLDKHGMYPADKKDNGAYKLDALRVQDEKGDYFYVSKPGLYNKDEMYALRGTKLQVDGKTFTQDANLNRADTALEKVHYQALKAYDAVKWNALYVLFTPIRMYNDFAGNR